MAVPFVDLRAQYAEIAAEVAPRLAEVLTTCSFVGGPQVAGFEEAYARECGVKHCVGVGNGTDAVELALRVAGVTPGGEVIVPANTFIATAEAASRIGARVVLADVDDEHLLIDPDAVAEAITPRTQAIVAVHLFGQVAPMERLAPIARAAGVALIEDAAQAHGARRFGRPAGGLADAAATSFYPGKNLGAAGDAGAVTTDNAEWAARLRRLHAPGAAPTLSLPDGSQTSVRAHLGIAPDERLIVVASRISSDLKLEGLLEAVAVMPRVDARVPARLVVVGDGPERPSLERAVEAARGSDGRATTILAGAYADPRPFYEAADLVIGMGSSILRGMAFDKPAVVQGVQGYWESVSAETVTTISRHGWYGVGDGRADLDRLARLITDALRWPNPGGWQPRRYVEATHSLPRVAEDLVAAYESVRRRRTSAARRLRQASRTTVDLAKFRARRLASSAREGGVR